MDKKIALVITYFGKLPFWFPAFHLSCTYNPDIQWLIFADMPHPEPCSDNVQFIPFSSAAFCSLASEKLQMRVQLDDNFLYKICDYKPAFGLIYEDFLQKYDFWGHCDMDILWGNIRSFMTENILSKYDIITSRPQRISGHFCLYRNEERINNIFINMPLTKKFLCNIGTCERLDEEHLSQYLHWLLQPPFISRLQQFFLGKPFVPQVYWQQHFSTPGASQRQVLEQPRKSFLWKKGQVYHHDGRELMYLHFHLLKQHPEFTRCQLGAEQLVLDARGIQHGA
jgi:hypothetical protein